MSGLLEKHSSSQEAVILACKAVPLYGLSLPSRPPLIMRQLLSNALSALSLHASKRCLEVVGPGMKLLITVLGLYPTQLHDICNVTQLASIMSAGIEPDSLADKEILIEIAQDCAILVNDTQFLSNADKDTLTREGVCYGLSSMLAAFHDNMPPQAIKEVTIAVMVLSNLSPSGGLFVNETFYTSLLFVAREHTANPGLQQIIWKALVLRCQKDSGFVSQLMAMDVLSVVVGVLSQDSVQASTVTSLLKFLTVCCHRAPASFIPFCLDRPALMQHMVGVVEAKQPALQVSVVADVCDFLAFLYSKCQPEGYPLLAGLDLVGKIQDCARRLPAECLLPACMASEAGLGRRPPDPSVLSTCHVFVRDALLSPIVCSDAQLLNMAYLMLQKLLRHLPADALTLLWERDFLELFVHAFIRDVYTHPRNAKAFVFTAHYFVFQMKTKDPVELLREFEFHTTVTDLISVPTSFDVLTTSVGLLASLVSKYHEFLKDLKPFIAAKLPKTILEKLRQNGHQHQTQFADDFARILLNLTADKDMSLDLFSQGFLDELVALLQDAERYDTVVVRAVLHAIGNIALGGNHIKKLLLERNVHFHLVRLLDAKVEKGDAPLLSACCRVLHIFASGDWAKRSLVECGCLKILLKLVSTRKDSVEIQWRPLGLLSSIGFMAMVNRRYILTLEVIEAVAGILRESSQAKVISYVVLVLLAAGELDEGLMKLRQLGIEEPMRAATENADYIKLSSDLARWGGSILEKLCLFTVRARPESLAALPQPAAHSTQDWPPVINVSVSPPRLQLHLSPSSASKQLLLPLEDAYMQAHFPTATVLTDAAREQLARLGLDPSEPLFRIGRVYGSTFGLCSNCSKDEISEELVIRPQSMHPAQYQELVDRGWYRRGGIKIFRLRRNHNAHCCDWETRVRVHEFDHRTHKSYRKVLRRMPKDRLTVETLPTHFNRDAFDLYNEYHVQRHEKPLKSEYSYCEHVVDSPVANCSKDGINYGTFHQLYRLDGKLVAIGIIDIVPSGIVSVYMWYSTSKEVCRYSFGVYSTLKEIELVLELSKKNPNMRYYYMQGWNRNNKKLTYKANYGPEEFYCPCITQDWVASLEGVDRARDAVLDIARQKTETEKATVEGEDVDMSESRGNHIQTSLGDGDEVGSALKEGSSAAKGTTVPSALEQQSKEKANSSTSSKPPLASGGEAKEEEVAVLCTALPNDRRRYCEQTGLDSITVEGIIVCLNLSHYVRFGEISNFCDISPSQYEIMSKRFSELIAALGPNLASHLVIDLKACQCPSSQSLGESGCSVSATSPGPMLAEM